MEYLDSIPCAGRRGLADITSFSLPQGPPLLTRREAASLGDGVNGRPLYFVVNGKVLKWEGPPSHPMFSYFKKLPVDKTLALGRERYDPAYGHPETEADMTDEFKASVEDTLATGPFADQIVCVAKVSKPTV